MPRIRPATPADVPAILHLVRSPAIYERQPDAVYATEADFLRDGFGERRRFECLTAEDRGEEERWLPVGFVLYFYNHSTWQGRPGIHLEDLFVLPHFRRRRIGKALPARVAARAVEQGFPRLGWDVLEWNQPAIDFYRGMGGRVLDDWWIMRVAGDALRAPAGEADPPERPR